MNEKGNILSALSRHQIKVTSIRGNHIETQNDYSIELKEHGLYGLSLRGAIKATFNDSDKMCVAIKKKAKTDF